MTTRKIVLVRHGRSGHVVKGLLDLAAYTKWRDDYEAAGLDPFDAPPPELCAAAQNAAVLVASDARRAIDSARLLAPGRDVVVSPLVRELSLQPPNFSRIRLPLIGWALSIGLRWLIRQALRLNHITPEEQQRVRAAIDFLIELTARHAEVTVVTHGAIRSLLAKELTRRGWISVTPRRRSSHWSAWSFAANQ
ncbi:MAG TPA: hypothetical protein VE010_18990 [Thermoanaerobaculia bacterium]|nr:hypothetical protein [Thermoanaerobaculia bacterium]